MSKVPLSIIDNAACGEGGHEEKEMIGTNYFLKNLSPYIKDYIK